MVLGIFPLPVCFPEILVAVVHIWVIDRHHFNAWGLVLWSFSQWHGLDFGPWLGRHKWRLGWDHEGQLGSAWNNDIMGTEVGEVNKKLLVLVDREWVVCHHNWLAHTLDPKGADSEGVGELTRCWVAVRFARWKGLRPWGCCGKQSGPPDSGQHAKDHQCILHGDTMLAERVRMLFCEHGITIASIITAIGMAITAIPIGQGWPSRLGQKDACPGQTGWQSSSSSAWYNQEHCLLALWYLGEGSLVGCQSVGHGVGCWWPAGNIFSV